jgi:hypothetical protein
LVPCPPFDWSGISWTFCLGWPWLMNLIFASQVVRFIGLSHHTWLRIWNILRVYYKQHYTNKSKILCKMEYSQ